MIPKKLIAVMIQSDLLGTHIYKTEKAGRQRWPRASRVVQGSRYHRYDIDYDIIGYDIDYDTAWY